MVLPHRLQLFLIGTQFIVQLYSLLSISVFLIQVIPRLHSSIIFIHSASFVLR